MIDPSKVTLVIYHADCSDGFGAAWSAWSHLGSRAEYYPAKHGTPPPDCVGKVVVCLDFAFPREQTLKMIEEADEFLIIDHHKTAMVELADVSQTMFDMTKSGAILAWEFFHPGKEAPKFIQYIQDRDLWRWQLSYSKEFSAAFDMVPFEFEEYDKHLDDSVFDEACKRGSYILAYSRTFIDKACKNAVHRTLKGRSCLVVNSAHWASEIGGRLAKSADVALVWFYDHNQGKIICGLRSAHDDIDVAILAKAFGGGGHRRAAGMQLTVPSIEDIFDKPQEVVQTALFTSGSAE
ncbi:hypothetical protein HN588_02260 [Candidatus Bathyarchaeota archaeon]|jgi:uncharacterized protein|nr:hypothetical protein [Candidatus Bathyarchaeota archaeon]